nr:alpha/beta hydrolase fold domain-containing protein [Amycolatopsis sp. FDAARGOS 1241]
MYPAQPHDVKAAVRWLRHPHPALLLDPDRFAAWGHAAGGHLAVMLAVTGGREDLEGEIGVLGPDSGVQAVMAWSAPSDFTRLPKPHRAHRSAPPAKTRTPGCWAACPPRTRPSPRPRARSRT